MLAGASRFVARSSTVAGPYRNYRTLTGTSSGKGNLYRSWRPCRRNQKNPATRAQWWRWLSDALVVISDCCVVFFLALVQRVKDAQPDDQQNQVDEATRKGAAEEVADIGAGDGAPGQKFSFRDGCRTGFVGRRVMYGAKKVAA